MKRRWIFGAHAGKLIRIHTQSSLSRPQNIVFPILKCNPSVLWGAPWEYPSSLLRRNMNIRNCLNMCLRLRVPLQLSKYSDSVYPATGHPSAWWPTLRSINPLSHKSQRTCSPQVKRLERETNQLLPSTIWVRNTWSFMSTHSSCAHNSSFNWEQREAFYSLSLSLSLLPQLM
jgi:hypothetical protein